MTHRLASTTSNIEASNALSRANSLLSARQPGAALKIYTDILGDVAPGHPCAFLNRSLCYLYLGYPELAVTDSQRAVLGTTVARLAGGQHSAPGKQIMTFWSTTQLAQHHGDPWATRPTCHVENGTVGLLDGDLACLYIALRHQKRPGFGRSEAIFHDVRMKAWYRLAYALWKCGGGALKSAIDVLEDASADAWLDDHKGFDALANRILEDIEKAIPTLGNMHFGLARTGPADNNDSRKDKSSTKDDLFRWLRTRLTFMPTSSYPWNDGSLAAKSQLQMEELREAFGSVLSKCQLISSTEDGRTQRQHFIAKEDVYSGEPISKESSAFHVISRSPLNENSSLYCDTCATKITAPVPLLVKLFTDSRPVSPISDFSKTEPGTGPSSVSSVKVETDRGEHRAHVNLKSTGDSRPADHSASEMATPTPTALPNLPPTPPSEGKAIYSPEVGATAEESFRDLQVCPCCKKVLFCSPDCFEAAAETYHAEICGKDMESCVGTKAISPRDVVPGMPHPRVRELQALLLGKLLAKAEGKECSPLELEEMWVVGEPSERAKLDDVDALPAASNAQNSAGCESERAFPWSFEDNVFIPLQQLFELGGINLALDTKRFDGWVMNTMLSKIQTHMRITKQPRCEKIYNEHGFVTEKLAFDTVEQNARDPTFEDETRNTWVGSLHPVLSLMSTAPSTEEANVNIREFGGTVLCTTKASTSTSGASMADNHDQPMDETPSRRHRSAAPSPESSPAPHPSEHPAIRAGDTLLRPPQPSPYSPASSQEHDMLRHFMILLPFDGANRSSLRSVDEGNSVDVDDLRVEDMDLDRSKGDITWSQSLAPGEEVEDLEHGERMEGVRVPPGDEARSRIRAAFPAIGRAVDDILEEGSSHR